MIEWVFRWPESALEGLHTGLWILLPHMDDPCNDHYKLVGDDGDELARGTLEECKAEAERLTLTNQE